MRIVFISTMSSAPWGGSEELWSQAAFRLREQNHDVAASVVWWPRVSPRVDALAAGGVRLRMRKPANAVMDVVWPRDNRVVHWWHEELAWVRKQKPDLVVIAQGGNIDGSGWMKSCRDSGLPFVAIAQCNSETWWPSDQLSGDHDMAGAFQAARRVFFVSHHNRELMERQIGVRLPNAVVICNPYNVSPDPPPPWPATDRVMKLACVARLEPAAKGQDLLFQILACSCWRERPLEVNVYGEGPCTHGLHQLAQYLRLTNVRFHGHVDDVRRIWEHNHALVMASRYEGLPLALVEAMWCGRPSVVTDVGGSAELCVDEETGFVASAPTVNLFAQAMERAWRRRLDWPEMGSAARARVEQLIPRDPVRVFCQQLLEGA